jgi:hypothetical protein
VTGSAAQPTATSAAGVDRAGRRGLTTAVVACAAGAGLVLLAAARTWSTTVTVRAAPLPPERVAHTGGGLTPWLPAVALVGLAGAGALLATRGVVRRAVGVLLLLVGLGLAAGGAARFHLASGGGRGWPVLVVVGGLVVAWSGYRTLRDSAAWPAMGSRYERADRAAPKRGAQDRGDAGVWDDIDRGVDPTIRDA